MRVLIAPDKFAGTLSAHEAARAIADGWRRVRPGDELVRLPLADGGPGTIDAVAAGRNGTRHRVAATDPLGRPITAEWWLGADGVGVIEVAATCGLHLLSPDERDPRRASSGGLGDVLAGVIRVGARELVIGLGGTATVDGGACAVQRLGSRFLTRDGAPWTDAAATALWTSPCGRTPWMTGCPHGTRQRTKTVKAAPEVLGRVQA